MVVVVLHNDKAYNINALVDYLHLHTIIIYGTMETMQYWHSVRRDSKSLCPSG